MGVPVFFKWMCMRNPKILKDAIENLTESFDNANPYVDNFYVDMNGLIHPSCNPKGQNIKEPANFEEQCNNVYEYIDKIMNIVRPKKLLYLAIDGVAPRAKMNQQRSRRFRAAMEGEEIKNKKYDLLDQYRKKDISTEEIQEYVTKKSFDSNLITPGTTFLYGVGQAIRSYIKDRLANHRLWKNLIVIFSDASCPGQGQHKIMDFIRQERASVNYNPNQYHCIYGADADLIMLGLATHEPRFYIIRQVVITANQKWCSACGKRGHYFVDCRAAESIQDEAIVQQKINQGNINVSFQFLNLKLIREYMHLTFEKVTIPFGYDLQRILDDFVFLCFFVGNDFLPHVPSLTIREGGIDILMKVYEYCLSLMPDYLTKSGEVNFKSLKILVKQMTLYEKDIINEIINKENQAKQRQLLQKNDSGSQNGSSKKFQNSYIDYSDPLGSFKEQIKKLSNSENNLENYSVFSHKIFSYKQKYYKQKFRITSSQFLQLKHQINISYQQALSWICHYYYKGVASWSWYYPFHYAPFFSDLDIQQACQFELGEPFKPFEQLMAVLPPKTCAALPPKLRKLMTQIQSPIADYFPSKFEIDLVGKKFAWLGQVLLPFIDDKRLLKAMANYQSDLNKQDRILNKLGTVTLYFRSTGQLGRKLAYYSSNRITEIEVQCEKHNLQGLIKYQNKFGQVWQYQLIIPQKRYHDVKLKEGIQYSLAEELNDDFMRRTDRKAFGGQRFVRILERSMNQRGKQLYGSNRVQELRRNNSRDSRDGNRDERSRTRQKRFDQPFYKRPYNNYNNERNDRRDNRNYSDRRDNRDNRDRGNRDNRDDKSFRSNKDNNGSEY